jgi:hypothetical protein
MFASSHDAVAETTLTYANACWSGPLGQNEAVTLRRRTRFRSHRDRAWWLLAVAAGAAAAWAVAQVLNWPVAARAMLAGLAAIVAVVVPELRALGARADRRAELLAGLEEPGPGLALPRVGDVPLHKWRVHAARTVVPFIPRDAETAVDAALQARRPLLLIGHSMAPRLATQLTGALPQTPPLPGTPTRPRSSAVSTRRRLGTTLEGGPMPKYGGRRYGYGRPGRRVRGYYRARPRQPGPIPGCLLPLVLAAAIAVRLARENGHRGPD